MKTRHIALSLLLAVLCLGTMFLIFKKCSEATKHAATVSTMKAIEAALVSELEKGNPALKRILDSRAEHWRFLTAKEYDTVIVELASWHNLDAPKDWDSSLPLLDPWGSRYEVTYRKSRGGNYSFLVLSKGPDRLYGSKDDLVSRRGVIPTARPDN